MIVTGAEPGRPPVEEEKSLDIKRDVKGPEIKPLDIRQVRPISPPTLNRGCPARESRPYTSSLFAISVL